MAVKLEYGIVTIHSDILHSVRINIVRVQILFSGSL